VFEPVPGLALQSEVFAVWSRIPALPALHTSAVTACRDSVSVDSPAGTYGRRHFIRDETSAIETRGALRGNGTSRFVFHIKIELAERDAKRLVTEALTNAVHGAMQTLAAIEERELLVARAEIR
jgi:5-deoxy-D-glucuronate isomerase